MGILDEIFDAINEATAPREIGVEFAPEKAEDAFELLKNTAVACHQLPVMNESGMFPRIAVKEHSDLMMLLHAMEEHGETLRKNLMKNVSGYAMGGTAYTWEELRKDAAEYVDGQRLANALRKVHMTWHNVAADVEESQERAATAYQEMDAVSAWPPGYAAQVKLVNIARYDTDVQKSIDNGNKIVAIKELRNVAGCSLREAKEAIDYLFNEIKPN